MNLYFKGIRNLRERLEYSPKITFYQVKNHKVSFWNPLGILQVIFNQRGGAVFISEKIYSVHTARSRTNRLFSRL